MGPGGVHTCAGWREYFPSRSRATGGEARSTCADADAGEEKPQNSSPRAPGHSPRRRRRHTHSADDDTTSANANPAAGVPRPSS